MTIPAEVSVYPQVFVPRDYDVFAGLDVDHHSIAATFTDHDRLMQSLRLPYSAGQLLNHVRKHFPDSEWPLFTKPVRPVLDSTMSWRPRAMLA